jgi:hypothetical protein
MRIQTPKATAFPWEITTLQVSFDTILPSVIHMLWKSKVFIIIFWILDDVLINTKSIFFYP